MTCLYVKKENTTKHLIKIEFYILDDGIYSIMNFLFDIKLLNAIKNNMSV